MNEGLNRNSRVYQQTVIVLGVATWLIAVARICTSYGWQDRLTFLLLAPVIITGGMFTQTFRLPLGSKFTKERVTSTLTDGFVILIACRFGAAPALVLAGVDALTAPRRPPR